MQGVGMSVKKMAIAWFFYLIKSSYVLRVVKLPTKWWPTASSTTVRTMSCNEQPSGGKLHKVSPHCRGRIAGSPLGSGQLVPKTTRTRDSSYPGQLVPKTTRTQDNSYPRCTQDNSHPGQIVRMTSLTWTIIHRLWQIYRIPFHCL